MTSGEITMDEGLTKAENLLRDVLSILKNSSGEVDAYSKEYLDAIINSENLIEEYFNE